MVPSSRRRQDAGVLTLGHAALSALLGASRQIAMMREYRTRLIADVVTGKVDVRTAAAKLPEEVPDSVQADDAPTVESPEDETQEAADA